MTQIPIIPGAGTLGWGFDIFDRYSGSSRTRLLFPLVSDKAHTWSDGPTDQTYLLPDNTSVENIQRGTGISKVFKTRSEVETFFSSKAKVNGSYGAFSGQFDASFSRATKSDSEYTYSMFLTEYHGWRLSLVDQQAAALASWVLQDPDFSGIPDTFTEANKELFFRFFDKYGTHYVSSVLVGYRLYYSSAVDKRETTDETTIEAKLKLEYNAVFVKAGADAQADWNQVSKSWTENRVVSVEAVGGDSSPLDAAVPGFGDNFSAQFKAWREKAERFPAVADFELTSISLLFSHPKRTAVEEAFLAYARDRVYAESKSDGSTILICGEVMTPPEPPAPSTSGFQVSILDRATLKPLLNEYVCFTWNDQYPTEWITMYNALEDLLIEYNDPKYLVVLAARAMLQSWAPPEQVYQQLISLGASEDVGGWLNFIRDSGSPYPQPLNYTLVGIPGRGIGTGAEALTRGDNSVILYNQDGIYHWQGGPAPVANLTISMRRYGLTDAADAHEPLVLRRASVGRAG